MNTCTLIGFVGKDPEKRKLQNGSDLLSFTLATNERYKDAKGELKTITCWHNISYFNPPKSIVDSIGKGSQLCIVGSIRYSSYETKTGEKRTTTYIAPTHVYKLESKANTDSTPASDEPSAAFINDDIPF